MSFLLWTATKNRQKDVIRHLLSRSPTQSWNFEPSERGRSTPDEWLVPSDVVGAAAVESGDPEIVQLYMGHQFSVNERLDYAVSPLNLAVCEGLVPMTTFLLERGADVHVELMEEDATLLGAAAWRDNPEIVRLLLEHGARVPDSHALEEAAKGGQIENAKLLLAAGADIDERFTASKLIPSDGDTPGHMARVVSGTALHAAVKEEQVDFARFLMSKGANVALLDGEGKTALMLAAEQGWGEEHLRYLRGEW
jgi:ankyrin repeat protein